MDAVPSCPEETPTPLAGRACANCKGSKKKCDRMLPSCSRCSRLSMDCSYGELSDPPETGPESKFEEIFRRLDRIEAHVFRSEQHQAAALTSQPANSLATAASEAEKSRMEKWQLNPAFITPSYMKFLLGINTMRTLEENRTNPREVGHKYFRTIHRWMPIVSEEKFSRGLEGVHRMEPTAEFALLVLSMFLVTANPSAFKDGVSRADSSLYRICKYQYSLFLSLGEPSIDFIQAGLLIAFFEHVQCVADRAYVTVGSCARMAYLLGLYETSQRAQLEERNTTWWAIIMMDRYINMPPLEIPRHLAIKNPWNDEALSTDYQLADIFSSHSRLFPSPDPRREDPPSFCLEAEAAWNLGRVQDFIRENWKSDTPRFQKALEIDRDLNALVLKWQNRQIDLSLWMGGFATTVCSALLLHSFCLRKARNIGERSYGEVSTLSLRDVLHATAAVSEKLKTAISNGTVEIGLLRPSWCTVLFQAVVAQRLVIPSHESHENRFTVFDELLRLLATEWALAGRYLDILHTQRPE
ncbi:hypothetical protein VTN77DRAFT_6871 [Rasamsonia byssochlamydoides]|uniref:uncharacterized protein n=1 Tax=Rasamsonia byssochlamydoides TaxID=89139 RepID=UPI003742B8F9